jgi:hypothetical protein
VKRDDYAQQGFSEKHLGIGTKLHHAAAICCSGRKGFFARHQLFGRPCFIFGIMKSISRP